MLPEEHVVHNGWWHRQVDAFMRLMRLILLLFLPQLGLANNAASQCPVNAPCPLGAWGSKGTGYGQLSAPYGVAIDPAGNVIVADQINQRITKFSPEGIFLAVSDATAPGEYEGVASDERGRIYAISTNGNNVTCLGQDLTLVSIGPSSTPNPSWIAYDAADDVIWLSSALNPCGRAMNLNLTTCLDVAGNPLACDLGNDAIRGRGLAVGNGILYRCATDGLVHRWELRSLGALVVVRPIPALKLGYLPWAIAVDRDGTLLISDENPPGIAGNIVRRHDSETGQVLACWGGKGNLPGWFDRLTGLACNQLSGTIYTVEYSETRPRIQGFNVTPPTPVIMGARRDGVDDPAITVTWSPLPFAIGYAVYRNGSVLTDGLQRRLFHSAILTDSVPSGAPYTYEVAGVWDDCEGPKSSLALVQASVVPNASRGLAHTEDALAKGNEMVARADRGEGSGAGLFVGIGSFAMDGQDADFSGVPYAYDDAIDLAFLFTIELELLDPRKVVLALSGTPSRADVQTKLQILTQLGVGQVFPTRGSVIRELSALERRTSYGDLLVASFATHGFIADGEGYLLTLDSSKLEREETSLRVSAISDHINHAKADKRLVFIDACREYIESSRGIEAKAEVSSVAAIRKAMRGISGSAVLLAATPGGYSFDNDIRKNGVFTGLVIDGIRGEATADNNGFITTGTLEEYVDKEVRQWIKIHKPEHVLDSKGISAVYDGSEVRQLPLRIKK